MKLPVPGDLFERKYRIEGVVGEGGFARVYGASVDGMGRRVAIKVLKPNGGGYVPTVVERFHREARIVAELRDPHTVTLHDCGNTEEGLLYMVYEYVEGEDLSQLLARETTLPEAAATHIMRQVLMSLREAHRAGLIHRDIKPSNIRLFTYLDDPLSVKLLDFGIAKPVEEFDSGLTKTGRVIGTPRYMSPEQIAGQQLAPRSDLYSLGLVAHEMLVGKARRGQDFMSQVAITRSDGVSEELCRVLNRMLVKAPERRFQTADEVLAALDAAERGPEAAPTEGKSSGPPALVLWAVAALVFAVVAGLVLRTVVRRAERAEMVPQPRIAATEPAPVEQTPEPAVEPEPNIPEPERVVPPPAEEKKVTGCGTAPAVSQSSSLLVTDGAKKTKLQVKLPTTYKVAEPGPLALFFTDGRFMQRSESDEGLAERIGMALVEVGPDDNPEEILEAARRGLCVDEARIFAIGSNAAADRAVEFSCSLPLAAVATSGLGEPGHACPDGDVPHVQFVATKDRAMPRKPAWTCEQRDFVGLDELSARLAERYQCDGQPERALDAEECTTAEPCGTQWVKCVVDGGRPWGSTEAVATSQRSACYGPATHGKRQGELIREFFVSVGRERP